MQLCRIGFRGVCRAAFPSVVWVQRPRLVHTGGPALEDGGGSDDALVAALRAVVRSHTSLFGAKVPLSVVAEQLSAAHRERLAAAGGIVEAVRRSGAFELCVGADGALSAAPSFEQALSLVAAANVRGSFGAAGSPTWTDGDVLVAAEKCVRAMQAGFLGERCPLAISDLYQLLPAEAKAHVRRHHKTMTRFLQHYPSSFGITAGRVYIIADGPPEQQDGNSGDPPLPQQAQREGEASSSTASKMSVPITPQAPAAPAVEHRDAIASGAIFTSWFVDPATRDAVGQVALTEVPPPPPDDGGHLGPAGDQSLEVGRTDGRTVACSAEGVAATAGVSVQGFTHLIPPFFVPTVELLKVMPGYTEEHVLQIFANSKTAQVVTVGRHTFVRLHGGYGRLDMALSTEAAELFARFDVDPTLSAPFEDAIQRRWGRGGFVPLQQLLDAAPPDVVARLPYSGPFALLFFAQLQHIYAFAPEGGGTVALLPSNFVPSLQPDTSPVPVAMCELLRLLQDGPQAAPQLEVRLSEFAQAQIGRFFGTFRRFLAAHATTFVVEKDTELVHVRKKKQQAAAKTLTLEQQLEQAMLDRDKKRIRRLRRRLHAQRNPSNPLLDGERLARAIYDFLPHKRHLSLKLLTRSLPFEIADLMPPRQLRFFMQYPGLFNVYEWREPTKWFVSRAEVPVPPGALRREYSEEEVLRIVAGTLQRFGGERPYAHLTLQLPLGARESARKLCGGIPQLLRKHPQYFSLVFQADTEDMSFCIVKLIAQPPATVEGDDEDAVDGLDEQDEED